MRRWWWRLDPLGSVEDKLDRLLEEVHMGVVELQTAMNRIFVATENIAADIQRLKAQIGVGMTPEEVAAVQTALDQAAARLEAVASETPDA